MLQTMTREKHSFLLKSRILEDPSGLADSPAETQALHHYDNIIGYNGHGKVLGGWSAFASQNVAKLL
jgi:hypothetical protein